MRVKICGLRRAVDAECAIELGASHVGVVLAADSPRCATREEAAAVVAVARGRAEPVLVFRGESHDAIVGVDLDYEVINNMLMVSASGTAVVLS